jgi:hypothetical protein
VIDAAPGSRFESAHAEYSKKLHPAVRDGFPSLFELYSQISEALHAARSDNALYEVCRQRVESHFEARALYARLADVAEKAQKSDKSKR